MRRCHYCSVSYLSSYLVSHPCYDCWIVSEKVTYDRITNNEVRLMLAFIAKDYFADKSLNVTQAH